MGQGRAVTMRFEFDVYASTDDVISQSMPVDGDRHIDVRALGKGLEAHIELYQSARRLTPKALRLQSCIPSDSDPAHPSDPYAPLVADMRLAQCT